MNLIPSAIEDLPKRFDDTIGIDLGIVGGKMVVAGDTLGIDGLVVCVNVEWCQRDLAVLGRGEPTAAIGCRIAALPALQLGVLTFESRTSSQVRVLKRMLGMERETV